MSTANSSDDSDDAYRQGVGTTSAHAPSALRLVQPPPAVLSDGQKDHEGAPLFTRPYVRLLGMQAAYGFSFSMFFLLPKYLAAAGESPSRIGFVMGGFGVACVATIPFLHTIVARLGRRGALMAATLCLAAAGAVFAAVLPDLAGEAAAFGAPATFSLFSPGADAASWVQAGRSAGARVQMNDFPRNRIPL